MFEAEGRKVACENSRPSLLPARVAFHGCFRRVEGKRKVAFHTITDCTLLTTNNRCNFFVNACREIRRISEQDVLPKQSADNIMRSYFRHYYTEFLSNCCLPNLRKLCESNNFVHISCNVKQGSYPFSETNFQNFSRTFPGLILIFQGL